MEQYEKIKEIVEKMSSDVEKFKNGNKAAGTRVRKAFKEIKDLAHEGRKAVVAINNSTEQ
jgi:methyl-accepting chemotaxis protein